MKELIYGVAYYPEYEPYRRTEKDFEMMKKVGINTIRVAESTWSTWEKREGEYDFSVLRETLDEAEKAGMKNVFRCKDKEEAKSILEKLVQPGAAFLCKASRGMALEELSAFITSAASSAAEQ